MAGLGLLVTAGCDGPFSITDAAGPAALAIGSVGLAMLAGGTVIWLAMVALVLWVMKSGEGDRRDGGADDADGGRGDRRTRGWIVGGGLVLPIFVMVPLFAWAVAVSGRLDTGPGSPGQRIGVEGYMWGWDFTYADHPGAVSTGTLYLPQGEPVVLEIGSRDVIHSFWIPRLAGKMDAIPGRTNHLRIEADEAGVLMGQCAEYCGAGHVTMRITVDVRAPADYAAAMQALAQGRSPEPPAPWTPVGVAHPPVDPSVAEDMLQ